MIPICFQGKPFDIIVIQVYSPSTDVKETEADQFYEDLQDLIELTPKKKKKKKMFFWLQGTGMQK